MYGMVISKLGFLGKTSRINNHIKDHIWPAQVIPAISAGKKVEYGLFSLLPTCNPRNLEDSRSQESQSLRLLLLVSLTPHKHMPK